MRELLVNCRNGATLERDADDWPVPPPRRRRAQVPSLPPDPAGLLELAALAGMTARAADPLQRMQALVRLRSLAGTDPGIADVLTVLGLDP